MLPGLLLLSGCRKNDAVEPDHAAEAEVREAPAPVSVTRAAEAMTAAGIKTEIAATRPVARRVSATGELEWNARRVVHLTARTPGRLERVLAVRGDRASEGQLLAEIYSPDFLSLQAEYLQAAARVKRHAGNQAEEGPAHHRQFRVACRVEGLLLAEGEGGPKRAAQQQAARLALAALQQSGQAGS